MKLNKKSSNIADRIFINGVIYSIDDGSNVHEAMAIKDGAIIALGNNQEINNYCNDKTEVIDLKFRVVLPGFIDAHSHIPEKMMIKRDGLSLFDANSLREYQLLIQTYIDAHPEEEIIYGVGWRNSAFEDYYNEYTKIFKGPSKKWLENVKTNKPIVLKEGNGHTLWLNDKAFDYFNITKESIVSVGGKIELDEEGELWGTLKENAIKLVCIKTNNHWQKDYLNTFIKYQSRLHSYGITSISIVDEENLETSLRLFKKLELIGKLKLRIICGATIMPQKVCKRTIYEQMHQLKRNRALYKSSLLDICVAKFHADGVIEKRTAYLFKEYESNSERDNEKNGMFLWDYSEFKEGIKIANRLEFNTCIHAAGDFACKLAIEAVEYSIQNNINYDYRNSLMHLDLITKYYIKRMKGLAISAIVQPFWFYKDVSSSKNEVLAIGEERAHRQYPLKSLIDDKIITAGASGNVSIENSTPLKAIECSTLRNLYDYIPSGYPERINMSDARYRLNPKERIQVIESVKMFTINAAYVLGKENEIGSLEVGKKADFIVLDRDLFKINLLEIQNINIERTYFNGKLVYLNE